MKTALIELSGGFHNSSPIRVRVPRHYHHLSKIGLIDVDDVLTPYQYRKLVSHFCGIDGCLCHSFPFRVDVKFL